MAWIEIGWIGKAHGLDGGFFVTGNAMPDTELEPGSIIRLGSKDSPRELSLIQAKWMPKGWKLRLSGIESPEAVKPLQRTPLFTQVEIEEDDTSFFPSELDSYTAIESETGKTVGTFSGVENLPAGPDRWWFQSESGTWAIPATEHYIKKVDRKKKQIELMNAEELIGLS